MFSWSSNYIYFDYPCSDGRCRTSIGVAINKDTFKKGEFEKSIQRVMDNIKVKVDDYIDKQRVLNKEIKKRDLHLIVDNVLGRKSKVPQTLKEDWERMMEEMRSGQLVIKKNKKRYKKGTIDRYSDNLTRILNFSEDENIPLNYHKIDEKWIDCLFSWAVRKDYSRNLIASLTSQFRSFLSIMYSKGIYEGTIHKEDYLYYPGEEVDAVVTYDHEIIAIYNLTGLSEAEERARDVYCFGCCVGLRADDLNRINEYHLVNDEWEFLTQKSSKKVRIPMHWLAREIYNKYNGKLPVYKSRNTLGPYLPNLCRKAKIIEKVLFVNTKGGVTKGTYYDKCDLVQAHTMRRSFATNAIIAGIPDNLVMEITGHEDWETFRNYIIITEEMKMKVLKDHPWFKGHQQIGLTGSDGK